VLTAVGMFAVFLGLYVFLNRRAGREAFPADQRGWLLAIVGCAGAALLIGVFTS
jgi:hypothetical protein